MVWEMEEVRKPHKKIERGVRNMEIYVKRGNKQINVLENRYCYVMCSLSLLIFEGKSIIEENVKCNEQRQWEEYKEEELG